MIVKMRVEAEAETMLQLVHDLDAVKDDTRDAFKIDDEHYERVEENGRSAHYKARLVLKEKTHARA